MSTTTDAQDIAAAARLDNRDIRALGEYLTVLADHGPAADADDLYYVVGENGGSYLVDVREQSCECPDAFHRDPEGGCKHVRRVQFATGEREIPACIDATGDLTVYGEDSA
jgi:hypothetical protein